MRWHSTMAVAMLVCPAIGQAETTSTVEFRYTPKLGQEMRHRLVMNSVGTMGFAPGTPGTRFTQSTTQETSGTCTRVNPDGSAVFEMTLARIATRMNMPGIRVDYDSRSFDIEKVENPALRMIGRLYSGLVGAKLTVDFNPQGSPSGVAGMRDAVLKAIEPLKKDLAKDPAGLLINPIIDNLAAGFDDSMIDDQLKSFYRFVPAGPIAVGEKWNSDWDMELPFLKTTCQAKGEYELLGVETVRGHRCAKIGIKESFAMNTNPQKSSKSGTRPAPGLAKLFEKMDMSLSASNGDGIAHWDHERGVLVQLRQTQRIVINIKFNPKELGLVAATVPATEPAPTGESTSHTMTQNLTSSIQVDLLEGEADEPATRKAAGSPAGR